MKTLFSHLLASAAALLVSSMALPEAGHAVSLQFTLSDCNDSSGCTPQLGNNFGTVKITDVSAGVVDVNVDLASNYTWAATGLEGFVFNLVAGFTGANTPTLSNVTATNWTPTSGAPQTGFNTDGMGSGQYGLDFTGANNSISADLNFRLTATGLDVTDFTTGGVSGDTGRSYYFLADICTQADGNCSDSGSGTGLVGAFAAPAPGPILGAGLPGLVTACGALVWLVRRRRQRAV